MGRFKLCFLFDEAGDYKPVPYSKLMDGSERREEYANRYFIPLNGYLLEVSHEDYLDHYKTVNRREYVRKEAKRAGEVSLQAIAAPDDEIIRDIYEDVAEQVISEMMIESLHKAIDLLDDEDHQLIHLLYFDEQTQQHCSEVFGVDQSTINRRKKRILKKLKNILMA